LKATRSRRIIRTKRSVASAWLAMLAAVGISSGCYQYVPVAMDHPDPGSLVRAALTPEGTELAVTRFGPGVREVHGMVLERQPSELALLIDEINSPQGTIRVDSQPLRFQPNHLSTLAERRFSAARSALFGVGLAAGAFALVQSLEFIGRQLEPSDNEPPVAVDVRIPFSLPGLGARRP
jgi:hypothetical protein